MKRIVCILCAFIFVNGCATKRLQLSIEAAKTETILLEYTDAMYMDNKLYLGFITLDNLENNSRINCVAEYDLRKYNYEYYKLTKEHIPKPVISKNAFIQKTDEGIKTPIYFIDKELIPKSIFHLTYYESLGHISNSSSKKNFEDCGIYPESVAQKLSDVEII